MVPSSDPTKRYVLRLGVPTDLDAMVALLPRLAAFAVPAGRAPEELYQADEQTVRHWSIGKEPNAFALIAESLWGDAPEMPEGEAEIEPTLLGFAFVRMRDEMLSGAPSAHLAVLVVAEAAQGRGVGGALVDMACREAEAREAQSMTLHVFANNTRAKGLYERRGFDGELLRMIKRFDTEPE